MLTEKDEAWVDIAWGDIDWDRTGIARGDVEWIDGGKRFLWASERDGWRHIYSISRDGTRREDDHAGQLRRDHRRASRYVERLGSTSSRHLKTQRSVISIACASTAPARKND